MVDELSSTSDERGDALLRCVSMPAGCGYVTYPTSDVQLSSDDIMSSDESWTSGVDLTFGVMLSKEHSATNSLLTLKTEFFLGTNSAS